MDRDVLRERKRKKQQQLRRRKRVKIFTYVAILAILAIFVVRGIILPLLGRFSSQSTETVQAVSTEVAQADPNAAMRQPLKGISDLGKLTSLTPGWHTDDTGKWYQNADGTYFAGGFQSISGVQYYFDEAGYVVTGWITKGVKDYYFNDDGSYNPSKKRPMIALTFDDGPGEYTDRLLDCLEENHAHATFFMLGQLVTPDDFHDYSATVRRMADIGCELGNHSWDHTQQTTLSVEAVQSQFSRTDNALIEVCGQPSTVARFPYGAYTQELIDAIDKPSFMWSLDSLDWSYRDADLDYVEIMEKGDLSDGTIILMHDIHEPSVECACRIIPELIEKGYKLVTVSEMAEAKNVVLQNASYTDFWDYSLSAGLVAGYQGEEAYAVPDSYDAAQEDSSDEEDTSGEEEYYSGDEDDTSEDEDYSSGEDEEDDYSWEDDDDSDE